MDINVKLYKEVLDANYIIKMIYEDVFGHRIISYSPKDTKNLHHKLTTPITDKEREEYVDKIEPIMNKQQYQYIPPEKSNKLYTYLDRFANIPKKDFEPSNVEDSDDENELDGIDITNLEL